MPADRVEALRAAFMATMQDPEFLAEAAAQNLEITPVDGATVQQLVADGYRADPSVVDRLNSILR